LKIKALLNYVEAHAEICCVLKGLQLPYRQAHMAYDQTHASYGQAHALEPLVFSGNLLNRKTLPLQPEDSDNSIWNGLWFG